MEKSICNSAKPNKQQDCSQNGLIIEQHGDKTAYTSAGNISAANYLNLMDNC